MNKKLPLNHETEEVKQLMHRLKEENYPSKHFKLKSLVPSKPSMKFTEKLTWYRRVLKATSLIDFECKFTDGNTCTGHYSGLGPKGAMCCCSGCSTASGYHSDGAWCTPAELKIYERRWNNYLGFWRPEIGCILPRERRSITCLFYNCVHVDKEDKRDTIDGLRSVAHYLQNELKLMLRRESE